MHRIAFQIALFPKEETFFKNPSKLITSVSDVVKDCLGMELEKQNIFSDGIISSSDPNVNFPRFIASTKNDSIVFQADTSKINLIAQVTDQKDELLSEPDFDRLVEKIITSSTLDKSKFKRFGYIRTFIIDVTEFAPYAKVALANEWEQDIDNFNMQLNYKTSDEDLNLNVGVSIASVYKFGTKDKAIQIQADVNTPDEEDMSEVGVSTLDILKRLAKKELTSKYIDPFASLES